MIQSPTGYSLGKNTGILYVKSASPEYFCELSHENVSTMVKLCQHEHIVRSNKVGRDTISTSINSV